MIKTTRAFIKNLWLASLLACLVALSLSFAGGSSAFAATLSYAGGSPQIITNECLYDGASLSTYNVGANQVDTTGTTLSLCGTNGTITNVTQKMVTTNGCEGSFGSGSDTEYENFHLNFRETGSDGYIYDEGCVTCEYKNGVLVGETYPNFTVILNVSSTGSYKLNGQSFLATSGNPITSSITIINKGLYAPPCPPTG